MLGRWSDLHGRRPFFLMSMLAACLPLGVVLLYVLDGFALKWYYIVQASLVLFIVTNAVLKYYYIVQASLGLLLATCC